MLVRGTLQNLYVALPVAFFSGLGVAVSVLDDQTASLVGVAISASLLPPAVNSGALWVAYFFTNADKIGTVCDQLPRINATVPENRLLNIFENSEWSCESILQRFGYHDYAQETYYQMGWISLMVTIANIILIWMSSMLMFRMKEVLPIKKKLFWNDLGIARKVYQQHALINVESVSMSNLGGSHNGIFVPADGAAEVPH
jgi:Domain of unknown function (DUF389)